MQGGANTRAAVLANIGAVSRADSAGALQVHPGQFAQALAALKAGRDIDYQGVGSVTNGQSKSVTLSVKGRRAAPSAYRLSAKSSRFQALAPRAR